MVGGKMRLSTFVKISILLFYTFTITGVVVRSELVGIKDGGGFREEGLKWHNHFRTLNNNLSHLELDHELNKLAHAQAEKLALRNELVVSESGFSENLWSHRGELLPLVRDLQYAIKCWYTGSKAPGGVEASIDPQVLRSDSVKTVGFGVGTSEHNGEGYTVVVAYYQ